MAKTGKQAKKDAAESSSSSGGDGASIAATLMTELKHRVALAADFKSSLAVLDSKLDTIQTVVSGQGQRITDLEKHAEEVCKRLDQLESARSSILEENKLLKAKLSDLEGRSRRQNIRIIGLPESVEGPRPTAFFSQLLVEVFGEEVLTSPPELDRAHRSLAAKPGPRERPRPVIVRFHRFQVKELIMREARRRRDLEFRNHRIRFYEDYSADVLRQRGEYKDVMAELYQKGLRPSLLYPARLRIALQNGERKWLQSVSEATSLIQSLQMNSSPEL